VLGLINKKGGEITVNLVVGVRSIKVKRMDKIIKNIRIID
jgi:hypothetical protein